MKDEKIWAVKDGYLVLRNGTIFNLNWYGTGKCVEVKRYKLNNGYLGFNCHRKTTLVHRFVAEAFLPNPDNLPCVNHKDENKANNCVKNLEWCSYKYNNNYGSFNKKVSESLKNHPKKSKTVYQYTLNGVFVKEWCSVREIERVLGFANTHISSCCLGKQKSAYDHLWYYKPLSALSESNNSPRVR